MTVEAAVLNSGAIAIAADSAVSFGDKVFYTADKIFRLHKDLPVGVMIFSSATYMGEVNWPVLVKEYAKELNGRSFPTLEEHAQDFINYIEKFKYITEEMKNDYFGEFIRETVRYILLRNVKEKASEADKPDVSMSGLIDEVLREEILKLEENEKVKNVIAYLDDNDIQSLDQYFKHKDLEEVIVNSVERAVGVKMADEQMTMLKKLVHRILVAVYNDDEGDLARYYLTHHAGVVFAGFGSDELFPSYIKYYVYGQLGRQFICHKDGGEQIHEVGNGGIVPFAQSDVIDLFRFGIDGRLRMFIYEQLKMFAAFVAHEIAPESKKETVAKAHAHTMMNIENFIRSEMYGSMASVISGLPEASLAEVAEFLINITSLKRHNTQEEETVGGPVDVALITKGDGFKWIKNKDSSKLEGQGSRF